MRKWHPPTAWPDSQSTRPISNHVEFNFTVDPRCVRGAPLCRQSGRLLLRWRDWWTTEAAAFSATVGGASGRTYKTITRGWSESAGASELATLGERFASTFARTRMLIFSEHASGLSTGIFTVSRSLVVPAVRPARPGPRDHRRRSRARVAARWAGRLRTARESR